MKVLDRVGEEGTTTPRAGRPPATRSWPRSIAWGAGLVLVPLIARLVLPESFIGVIATPIAVGLAFGVAAIGLNIAMGYAGQVSLGHAAFLGVGAYSSALVTERWRWSFLAGVATAVVITSLTALLLGVVSLRIRGLYLAVSTLAFSIAMYDGLFKTQFLTGGSAGAPAPRPVAGNFIFTDNMHYIALLVALVLVVWHLDRNLTRSKLGRAFNAIRADEDMAASLGVNVTAYKTGAFVLAGVFTGVAGAMYAPITTLVQPDNFRFDLSLLFVIMLVVGGLGSRVGVFSAAVAFTVFPRLLDRFAVFTDLQFLVGALLLLVTLVRHPGGFAQVMSEGRERKRSKAEAQAPQTDDVVMAALPAPKSDRAHGGASAGSSAVLEVRDLSVRFGGLQAVDEATFDVQRGKIVGLIGPNGAGKTTCFNAISGLVRPTSGSIRLLGRDVTNLPAHERASLGIGRTFQMLGLAKDLTVMDNLLLAQHRLATYPAPVALLRPPPVARREADLEEAAREALAALRFERFAEAPLRTLSHGQQRLVELAAALVTSPELLLLDEPSGGMAPSAAESLAQRLIEIRDRLGHTVLLIEHHIPLVLAVCDTVHVLSAGSILASGAPSEIVTDAAVVEAYLGTTAGRRAQAQAAAAADDIASPAPASPRKRRTAARTAAPAKAPAPKKRAAAAKPASAASNGRKPVPRARIAAEPDARQVSSSRANGKKTAKPASKASTPAKRSGAQSKKPLAKAKTVAAPKARARAKTVAAPTARARAKTATRKKKKTTNA
ncbi:MAG TPA: branched-chain amino acid ABC transporter ATP-binding protein/permease [Actinomycetota bacterium]|nr:branched-chain amino acid ABC transporter ATP-binding protein/permease [Actinomycetota bacterium]